ncbi:MAG: ABC transporter permease [Desulfobacterales bacterium]|nr:MAG: ABC transporter permease [Desulfobacterales bacterium]
MTYIIKRLLLFIPTLIGVITLVFLILHAIPGSPATRVLGEFATAESIAEFERRLGLDRPLIEQYIDFVTSYATGDFGESYRTGEEVIDQLALELPYTLHLVTAGMIIAIIIGVGLGIVSAIKPNSLLDNIGRIIALLGVSMPVFWSGMILIILFGLKLGWFPIIGAGDTGDVPDILHRLVLPAFTVGFLTSGVIMRMTRSSMLEVLDQDYIRTAFSKGLADTIVYLKHALKNAAIPIVTVIGLSFGGLLSGTVLTETIFARHGLGKFLVDAILWKDYPAAQGCIFVISLMFLVINLITDLIYGVLDPRIRHA